VRPYLIAKQHNLPFSSQVAAWLVERLLDLLMILLFFGMALTRAETSGLEPGTSLSIALRAAGYLAGFIGLVALSLLIGMRQMEGKVRERLTAALSFLPEAAFAKVSRFLEAFEEGMHATRNGAFAAVLVLLTVAEWGVIATAFGCVLRAFPATHAMGIADIAMLLGFVCFGGIIQIPGVGGGTQIVSLIVLTELFGLGIEAASSIALVLWLVTYVSIVPVGFLLAFHDGLRWRTLRQIDSLTESKT
jgi:glycosyltransferase 2 family protein